MKSVNTHQVTQHWAVMMNWPFAFFLRSFILLLHLWAVMVQWASAAGRKKERRDQTFISRFLAQQGVKHMWLNWDMSIAGVQKRESCPLCISCILACDSDISISPSGLSLVWCCAAVFSRQLFPCCFYYQWVLCGRSRAGASDHRRCTIFAAPSTSSWFSTCGWFESLQNLL